jgi:hypothetical protein
MPGLHRPGQLRPPHRRADAELSARRDRRLPLVPVVWGVLIFHEHVRAGTYLVFAGVSAIGLAVAVVILARSPVLSDDRATVTAG